MIWYRLPPHALSASANISAQVLTIPPGKKVEVRRACPWFPPVSACADTRSQVNTVFSGVPNKFLENGTLTNHRGVRVEDTQDYVMPDTAPDDMCDVSKLQPY